ncbi:unnamed protein product [Merluccius merluccius]
MMQNLTNAIRPKVEVELQHLEDQGILSKVDWHVDWVLDADARDVTAEGSTAHQASDEVAHAPEDFDDDTEQAETVASLVQGPGE